MLDPAHLPRHGQCHSWSSPHSAQQSLRNGPVTVCLGHKSLLQKYAGLLNPAAAVVSSTRAYDSCSRVRFCFWQDKEKSKRKNKDKEKDKEKLTDAERQLLKQATRCTCSQTRSKAVLLPAPCPLRS